ncbi:MAG: hypothetical protein WD906_06275 [Anaerolineales bacterium]
MEIGMLWFDDGPGTVKEKVARAAEFYAAKYGQKATVCMLHPDTLGKIEGRVAGVELLAERAILPHHFWIGVEESTSGSDAGEGRDGKNKKARPRAGKTPKRGARKSSAQAGAGAKSELRVAA